MNDFVDFIIFHTLFTVIFLGMVFFLYFQVSTKLECPHNISNLMKYCFFFLTILLYLGNFTRNVPALNLIRILGYAWLGIVTVTFTLVFLGYLSSIVFPQKSKLFISSALILGGIISVYSYINGTRIPVVKVINIPSKNIPPAFSSFSILHLSDLHITSSTNKKWLQKIVNLTNSQEPDLIVITGDIFNSLVKEEDGYFDILRGFTSKYGVYAVTGNHDLYLGTENFKYFMNKSQIRLLRNEKVTITKGIEVIGIDDLLGNKEDITCLTVFNRETVGVIDTYSILLYHRPYKFKEFVSIGIDIQLSGHLHAGQIFPMELLTAIIYKYPYGLFKYKESYIYTSAGTGTWGPAMRFISRSEIVKVVIHRVEENQVQRVKKFKYKG